jgi:N-acetylneuraminic acid mutarotase
MKERLACLFALVFMVVSCIVTVQPAYAQSADSWISKAPMQQGRNCKVAVVNQKIYAIGGNIGGFLDTNEEYDPATNIWTFKAPMPTPRSHFGIAAYQNKIYCIGGYIPGDAYWSKRGL